MSSFSTFVTAFLLCLFVRCPVIAQEPTLTPPVSLETGDVLIATSDSASIYENITQLWRLNTFVVGGSKELFLTIEQENYIVYRIGVTSGGGYLFTLEIEAGKNTGFVPLGESQLVRTNLQTGEREVMLKDVNLADFNLSPNAAQALIHHYPEELTFVDRYDLQLRAQWCIATFQSNETGCKELTLPEDTLFPEFLWVSDHTLVYTSSMADNIYVLNTDTLTTGVLKVPDGLAATQIRRLSDNQLLIFDSVSEGRELLRLDLQAGIFSLIGNLSVNTIDISETSPQGEYIVALSVSPASVVNIMTGEVLQTFPTLYNMSWTSFRWLPGKQLVKLIGEMNYTGLPRLTVVLEPFSGSTLNVFEDIGGRLLVVP